MVVSPAELPITRQTAGARREFPRLSLRARLAVAAGDRGDMAGAQVELGRSSARQWNDILGIMKQQGIVLDFTYLGQWADVLGVRDLLERALVEAGLKQP